MEKLLFKPYDKEHMRMAMLKHEATFKEQVYELHRLYQIQKIMMRNMGDQQSIRKVDPAIRAVDHSIIDKINIRDETDGCDNPNTRAAALEVIDESEIELTLGPTSYSRRAASRARKPETGSDSGLSFSSSSTGSSQMNRTTGPNNNNNRDINSNHSYETTTRLAETASFNGIGGGVEEEMRVKHPPWLFQVLSLNMST